MYRTPRSSIDTLCENIENILCDAKSVKTIFMCGHLNIEERTGTKHFLDVMHRLGLSPLIDQPTRITESSATLIDNIFTNELRHNLTCDILFNDMSDHLPASALTLSKTC